MPQARALALAAIALNHAAAFTVRWHRVAPRLVVARSSFDDSDLDSIFDREYFEEVDNKYNTDPAPRGDSYDRGSSSEDFRNYNYDRGGGGGGRDYDRGGRSSFGGGRRDRFAYSRAPDDDGSPVDEAAVYALLAERGECKKFRRFDDADAIRDQLKAEHGVNVYDKDRVWGTGRFGRGRGPAGGGGRQAGGRGGRRGPQDLGPKGHDYTFVGAPIGPECELDEAAVDALLAERLQAKFARDFSTADVIQDELSRAGVRVHDRQKVWRADGEGFDDDRGGGGRFERGGGRGERRDGPYAQSSLSAPLEPADVAEVEAQLALRTEMKMARDFDAADAIRDSLRERYGVEVNDRLRAWSVGGDFDEASPRDNKRDRPDLAPFVRRGGGDLSDDDVASVQAQIEARIEAKKSRDYERADAIREELQAAFSVTIDDRSREWRVVTDDYARAADSATLGAETEAAIDEMLAARLVAKKEQDYETADKIRDELMDKYGVTVNDRVREWSAAPGEGDALLDVPDDAGDASHEALEPAASLEEELEPEGAAGGAADAAGALPTADELAKLTIPKLKELLKARKAPVSGRKGELIERLLALGD